MFAPEKIVRSKVHADGTTTYLIQSASMNYFTPSGRASMSVKVRYHVYARMVEGDPTDGAGSQFNFRSKAEALKHFNSVR